MSNQLCLVCGESTCEYCPRCLAWVHELCMEDHKCDARKPCRGAVAQLGERGGVDG